MIKRSTWILVGIFSILVVVAIIIQGLQERKTAQITPTTASSYLIDSLDNPIVAMKISDYLGNVVEVKRGAENMWELVDPMTQDSDASRIGSVVSGTERIRIISTVDTPIDLKVIGLNPPKYRIEITFTDGQKQIIFVGDPTPTGSGYYAHLNPGPIQIVYKYTIDDLIKLLTEPPILPTPTISPTPLVTPPVLP